MVEALWVYRNPVGKIIESFVTGNIGYHQKEPGFIFEEGTKVTQTLKDGAVITQADHLNLQWHLRELEHREVLLFCSEEDSRLPLISRNPVILIEMPR